MVCEDVGTLVWVTVDDCVSDGLCDDELVGAWDAEPVCVRVSVGVCDCERVPETDGVDELETVTDCDDVCDSEAD